jgi:hypothetical protein
MYDWISSLIPERYAVPVAALIYAIMLVLVLYFAFEKEATFNYLVL